MQGIENNSHDHTSCLLMKYANMLMCFISRKNTSFELFPPKVSIDQALDNRANTQAMTAVSEAYLL